MKIKRSKYVALVKNRRNIAFRMLVFHLEQAILRTFSVSEATILNIPKHHLEHFLILLLMSGFLFTDTLVGAMEIYLGIHLKISLLYKTPVLIAVCIILAFREPKFTFWILLSTVVFLIGPMTALVKYSDPSALFFDVTLILKVLTPLLFFRYFIHVSEVNPELLQNWGAKVIWINYLVLLINMLVGLMGFGYTSYNNGVGINGFFTAGNELGAVFVVLSAYVLTKSFKASHKTYIAFSILTLIVGLLISTKTSILSALVLVVLIPAVIAPRAFFKPTPLKITLVSLFLLSVGVGVAFSISLLQSIGIWERILFMYEKYGIMGAVLSGRDVYAHDLLTIFYEYHSWTDWFFGIGTAGISHHWLAVKESAEIDPVDVLISFGHLGLFIALTIQIWMLKSISERVRLHDQPLRRASLLVFYIFLVLAFTSGHIWLSGMVGPFTGLIYAMTYLKPQSHPKTNF